MHYQGVAKLANGAMANVDTSAGEDLAAGVVPYEADGKTEWAGAFGVEWLRICECPWERLAQFENKHLAVPEWYEMEYTVLLVGMWIIDIMLCLLLAARTDMSWMWKQATPSCACCITSLRFSCTIGPWKMNRNLQEVQRS